MVTLLVDADTRRASEEGAIRLSWEKPDEREMAGKGTDYA